MHNHQILEKGKSLHQAAKAIVLLHGRASVLPIRFATIVST